MSKAEFLETKSSRSEPNEFQRIQPSSQHNRCDKNKYKAKTITQHKVSLQKINYSNMSLMSTIALNGVSIKKLIKKR